MSKFWCSKCEFIGEITGKSCPQCGNEALRELPPGLELKDGNMSLTATLATVEPSSSETGRLEAITDEPGGTLAEGTVMEEGGFTEAPTMMESPPPKPNPGDGSSGAATMGENSHSAKVQALQAVFGEAPKPSLEGTVVGPCRLEKKLGEGAMGVVYKGFHPGLQKTMAVKILPPEFAAERKRVELFIQEARSAAKLDHPNIIRVYDVGNSGELYYIAMEFVDGTDLMEMIKKKGTIPLQHSAKIILEAAKGLMEAQKNGIVHRDIKPDNIMLARGGVVKISDFGLARQVDSNFAASREGIMGTPLYMAPECIDGRGADIRSDLYALGITFYMMLSGKKPITGKSVPEIFINQMNATPAPLKDFVKGLPPIIDKIIRKLLEKNPDNRYQRAEDLVGDLTEFIEGGKELRVEVPSESGRDLTKERLKREKEERQKNEKAKKIRVSTASFVGLAALFFFFFGVFQPSLTLKEARAQFSPQTLNSLFKESLGKIKDGDRGIERELALVEKMWGRESSQYNEALELAKKREEDQWRRASGTLKEYQRKKRWARGVLHLYKLLEGKKIPSLEKQIRSQYTLLKNRLKSQVKMVFIPPQNTGLPSGKGKKTAPFLMDCYEVTNGEFYDHYIKPQQIAYREFPGWKDGKPTPEIRNLPLRGVSYAMALEYASSQGKRLPTQEEWMVAARGEENWLYPWGNSYQRGKSNNRDLAKGGPVSVYDLKDFSPFGVYGMAGNVAEWTGSTFSKKGKAMTVLGGAWTSSALGVAAPYSRIPLDPEEKSPFVGFRCVKDF